MHHSFYEWLSTQVHRDDDIGELARLSQKDPLFPRRARRLYLFLSRFEGRPQVQAHVKKSHSEWRRLQKVS